MANTPNLGLRKIDSKSELFNQTLNYEANFDKVDAFALEVRTGKVDKVTGKVLSTNDYTTEEKTLLNTTIPAQLGEITSTLTIENQIWGVI